MNDETALDAKNMEELDGSQRLGLIFNLVRTVLDEMGIADVTLDSVVTAPAFYDGDVLVEAGGGFIRFINRFSNKTGCLGYAFNDVAFLTVRQFCESYIEDSYPEIPNLPLSEEQYKFRGRGGFGAGDGAVLEFPICFVLGCPRSGTTLLRTMLNVHDQVWAPGELNLAHYASVADRARMILPTMRYSIIPECASRFGESTSSFSKTLRGWEREALPISEVYEQLYAADPSRLIIDKSPAYSVFLEDLEVISSRFRNARFVHIIRSPHDVIRSFVKLQMYKNAMGLFRPGLNPYQMGEIFWHVHNSNIIHFLSEIPNERKCTLRYEALVSEPREQLAKVCTLLDLSYDPGMADPYKQSAGVVALGASDVHLNSFEKVENREPSVAFYPIGSRCLNLVEELGY